MKLINLPYRSTLTFAFLLVWIAGFCQEDLLIPKYCNESSIIAKQMKAFAINTFESGNFTVDAEKLNEKGGFDKILEVVRANFPGTELKLRISSKSSINPQYQYLIFDQYHDEVRVKDGGLTVTVVNAIPDDPEPDEPCYSIVGVNPYLRKVGDSKGSKKTIEISDVLKSISEMSAVSAVDSSSIEMVYASKDGECDLVLAYEVEHKKEGYSYKTYISALTGSIIESQLQDSHLQAPTINYGVVSLDDSQVGTQTRLVSSDGVLRTYDYLNISGSTNTYDEQNIGSTSTFAGWLVGTSMRRPHMYQVHHTASEVLSVLEQIGITYGEVHAKATSEPNAVSWNLAPLTNAYISMGSNIVSSSTQSFALYDIIAHELAHSYIRRFFSTSGIEGSTFHEGLADVIGTYAEAKIQTSGIDWIMCDDDQFIFNRNVNLQNPPFSCVSTMTSCTSTASSSPCPYDRSGPLTRWFYLLVEGNNNSGIQGVGLDCAISIVMDAIMSFGAAPNYITFRDATLSIIETNFGRCSEKYTAAALAWNEVCVGNNITCEFSIDGPIQICSGNDNIIGYDIDYPVPGAIYRWTFPMGWNVQGNTDGDNIHYGSFIRILSIPTYSSYPRTFTINVYSPTLGSSFSESITVRIVNCNGNPCNYYPNWDSSKSKNTSASMDKNIDSKEIDRVIIYNLLGQEIRSFKYADMPVEVQNIRSRFSGYVVIAVFLDNKGGFIASEKKAITY